MDFTKKGREIVKITKDASVNIRENFKIFPLFVENIGDMTFFYKKELIFDSVTDALSMFVERRCNAVQIRLMAVI